MMCRWHPDDICHPPAKSHLKSHSCVIRTSSACHPHEISTGNIFPLKEQTALLKTKNNNFKFFKIQFLRLTHGIILSDMTEREFIYI